MNTKEIMRSRAYGYAEDVLSGKVMAPRTIKQQAQHFLDELKKAEKGWRYVYDPWRASLPVQFCEKYLLPTAGQYETFRFLPWQCFVDGQAFGWIDKEKDVRRFREVLEFVPRGNGKTARSSGKMGYMSTKGGERGAENYFAANNAKQARRQYMDFYGQMSMSPVLKNRIRLRRQESLYEPDFTRISYLANDPASLDGLRPYFVIKDEMESETSFDQINQLMRPMKKRRQPLMWYTLTAGTVLDGPAVYHYNYAKKILDRAPEIAELAVDTYLPILYEIDPDLPYDDPRWWPMANPSIPDLLSMEDLILDWERAKRSPQEKADFVTKQLNRFAVPPEAVFVDLDTIRRNDQADIQPSLIRRRAWAGFDLAKSEDFCAAAIVWEEGGTLCILQHSWVPEDKIRRGNGDEEKDWAEWVRRGWLTITPGHYVRYEYIAEWFKEQTHTFDVACVGYDPYNAPELVKQLTAENIRTRIVRQGPLTFNAPMKSLKERLLDGKVLWGHDEMFGWYLRNVRLRADFFNVEKENWYPTKGSRYAKIDGFMAAMNAYITKIETEAVGSHAWDGSRIIRMEL